MRLHLCTDGSISCVLHWPSACLHPHVQLQHRPTRWGHPSSIQSTQVHTVRNFRALNPYSVLGLATQAHIGQVVVVAWNLVWYGVVLTTTSSNKGGPSAFRPPFRSVIVLVIQCSASRLNAVRIGGCFIIGVLGQSLCTAWTAWINEKQKTGSFQAYRVSLWEMKAAIAVRPNNWSQLRLNSVVRICLQSTEYGVVLVVQ